MVLKCPLTKGKCNRAFLHETFYFKIDKITGKSRFQGKATLISVVAGYRNTMFIYQIAV